MPPAWLAGPLGETRWSLAGMDDGRHSRGPEIGLRSRGVFVYDLDQGVPLLSRNADELWPVASLTKLITALALVSDEPDLDSEQCFGEGMRPAWPGAHSKLDPGDCAKLRDLVGAALVSSDNGAAYALADASGLPYGAFIGRMNRVAGELGMEHSSFSDPSGAEDDNLSTPREITKAALAAAMHPDLEVQVGAGFWDLEDTQTGQVRRMKSTNRMRERIDADFLLAKTGYTHTARFCFTTVLRTSEGRTMAITLTGARWGSHRWHDLRIILDWLERDDAQTHRAVAQKG